MGLVLAYGRVSTGQQADAGALERQRQTLLERAGADEVIVDTGSGTTTKRPGYQRMLKMISSGQVDRVICTDADRLNRALSADLELWALCQTNGTEIRTLDGRAIEFQTADGTLMSTINSALNQHRSQSYSQKIKRGLEAGRKQGLPTRSAVPFGLMLVRDERGRVTGVDLDPDTAPKARQRIDWFLDGESLATICRRSVDEHQITLQVSSLNRWLRNPMLTGRLCWHRDKTGNFATVADTQTFPALMGDNEANKIRTRLSTLKTERAIRGRKRRPFSGLVRCADCGTSLLYITKRGKPSYLRCNHYGCPQRLKIVRIDQVFAVLQYALAMHAQAVAPLLGQPRVEPPEAAALRREIDTLKRITGTEAVVAAKEAEIAELLGEDTDTPIRALVSALKLPHFWLQDDEPLNDALRLLIREVVVQLGPTVADSKVQTVHCRCSPSEAPLPKDQNNPLIPLTRNDVLLAVAAAQDG